MSRGVPFLTAVLIALGSFTLVAQGSSDRVDVGALPLANYSSDRGIGFGANGALFWRAPEYRPYRYTVGLNLFFTTRNIQDHMLRLDAPRFLGGAYRPTFLLRFERDPVRPYYGIGNHISIDRSLDRELANALYLHTFTQGQASLTVERTLSGPWEVAASLIGGYAQIDADRISRLTLEQPVGATGGTLTELSLELAYDSRDAEASTTRGMFTGLTGRVGQLSGRHAYAGAALVARGYVSPFDTPLLTIAARLMVDLLAGDVPFTRLGTFAGRPQIAGIGGSLSLRGIPRYLYIGKIKTVANVELRSRLRRFHPGDHTLDIMAVAFADIGRVWAGYTWSNRESSVGPLGLHGAVGGGLRVAWEEDYVVRVDIARSGEGFTGLYIDFNQAF